MRSKRITQLLIMFIYKGGNLMRIIANEMFKKMPPKASSLLYNFYKPFFYKYLTKNPYYIIIKLNNIFYLL